MQKSPSSSTASTSRSGTRWNMVTPCRNNLSLLLAQCPFFALGRLFCLHTGSVHSPLSASRARTSRVHARARSRRHASSGVMGTVFRSRGHVPLSVWTETRVAGASLHAARWPFVAAVSRHALLVRLWMCLCFPPSINVYREPAARGAGGPAAAAARSALSLAVRHA
nr:MAG: hypothetical protein [Molluscum contagiosum virus]